MRIKIILFCFWLICTLRLEAQQPQMTLANILQHHTLSLGNQDSLKKIQTMKLSGIFSTLGYEYPIIIYRQRPNLCRIEIQRDSEKIVCFYDGQQTWQKTNKGDSIIESPLNYATLLAFRNFDILPDYKSNGIKIELIGQEVFEGRSTYKLQLKFSDGYTENWFINSSTFQLLKVSGRTRWFSEQQAQKTILYMDYKPIKGIYIPHYIFCDITTFSSEIEIQEVEINPNLDPGLFK